MGLRYEFPQQESLNYFVIQFQRAVIVVLVGSHILDLIYHIHTFQHLAEHGISIVQMRHSTMLDVTLLQLLGWQSVGFRTLSLLLLYIVFHLSG